MESKVSASGVGTLANPPRAFQNERKPAKSQWRTRFWTAAIAEGVFMLRDIERRSIIEASAILNLSATNVKTGCPILIVGSENHVGATQNCDREDVSHAQRNHELRNY